MKTSSSHAYFGWTVSEDNANTRERYIYIHGTNQEGLLGTPASHGCVRMSNADIAECFEKFPKELQWKSLRNIFIRDREKVG